MPIEFSWLPFTKDDYTPIDIDQEGVYEFGDSNGMVVYVGSTNAIKTRLARHLACTDSCDPCIQKHASQYRVEYTSSYERQEWELYNEHVRIYGRPPICNDVSPPEPQS